MSSRSTNNTGSVASLWRYAVKSMRGEELDEALVNDGGIFGDRAYAVIDPSNGSADELLRSSPGFRRPR